MIKEASGVFPELIALMDLLSASGQGQGYLQLFQACCNWLENFDEETLVAASTATATATGDEITNSATMATSNAAIRSATYMLSYVCETLNAIRSPKMSGSTTKLASVELAAVEPNVNDELNRLVQKRLCVDFYQDTFKLFEQVGVF